MCFLSYPLFHEWVSLALQLKVILLCAGLMLWLLRIPLCYELTARQDNHQERPVAWSFTTLGAPPDPGTCIHHRVLGSSPKSPAAAKGRGRSLFLWLAPPRTFKIVLGHSWHTLVRWNTAEFSWFILVFRIILTSHVPTRLIKVSYWNSSGRETFCLLPKFKAHVSKLFRSLILKYKRNKKYCRDWLVLYWHFRGQH